MKWFVVHQRFYRHVKKIAILLLGHRDPDLINVFIDQILSAPGEHAVFVHIDRKVDGLLEQIRVHPRVHLIPERVAMRWADITQVQAMLTLIRAAVADEAGYEVLAVRSGQDLALRAEWPEVFAGEPRSWFTARRIQWDEPFAAWFRCRWPQFTRQAYRSKWHPGRITRGGILALAKRGIRLFPNRRRLPEGWSVYHGTQWVTLARSHARHVLKSLEDHPEILDFFAEVLSPEERLFQTVIMNSIYADEVILEKSHYEEFVGNHPRILTLKDFELLRDSGKPFARKFDPGVDGKIVAKICDFGEGDGSWVFPRPPR